MATLAIALTAGTGSSATEPQRLGKNESTADLETVLPEHAQITASGTSVSGEQLVMNASNYEAMIAELRSARRWAELLSDSSAIDLLERMADEALAEDDAGLSLDLDDLLA